MLVELIAKKRDGGELSGDEIHALVSAHASGELADYQMSAWLMAAFFRGLSENETFALLDAMLHSGKVLDLQALFGPKIDKHSTGGVGDKVSICLAPLVASCGVLVPMVCGRGLGHTGGTLDKLEAIPGFRVDLDEQSFVRILREVGTCIIGQTAEIAPADKRIYALRDVTATVESIPLIVASILSKKLAEGIDGLVLDVKVGRGAFMRDLASARQLARALVKVGTRAGKRVVALLTDMSAPLGRSVGNAMETREAIEVLHGGGPADLVECTMALGVEMLILAGSAKTDREARLALAGAIRSGCAAHTMERMVRAQGGNPAVVQNPALLPSAPHRIEVTAASSGFVTRIDARAVGLAAVSLGAGRSRADQKVDPAVGIEILQKPGDPVKPGTPLALIHSRTRSTDIEARVLGSFSIGPSRPKVLPMVLDRIAASATKTVILPSSREQRRHRRSPA
jgi:pyrimidine-nucleoside phosphorylase